MTSITPIISVLVSIAVAILAALSPAQRTQLYSIAFTLLGSAVAYMIVWLKKHETAVNGQPPPPEPPPPVPPPPPPPPLPVPPPPPPVVGPPPVPPPPPAAGPPIGKVDARIAMNAFTHSWNGQFVVFGNPYGAQCVVIVNVWCRTIGIEEFPGNAMDFEYDSHPDCDWIANTPTNHPVAGDIVVWGKSVSLPFGHVDICNQADGTTLEGFDQNWPLGSPCHIQRHDYRGVNGWLRPHKLWQEA